MQILLGRWNVARVSKEPDYDKETEKSLMSEKQSSGPWRQPNDERMDVKFVEKCVFLIN